MADLLGKIIEAVCEDAPPAGGGRGGRGTKGYPVPPEDRPEDHFQLTTDDDPVSEAGEKTPSKSIEHLEDLSPHDFLKFLEKYRNMHLEGGLEISEKVDGSARMTFGIENGKLWTQSKNGVKKFSSNEYPDKPMFSALKHAHRALEGKRERIISAWPQGVREMVAEVLYTKIPNTIEYGPNVIIIHGGVPATEGKKFIQQVGNKLTDGHDRWALDYKRVIDPKSMMVDVQKEYETLGEILRDLKGQKQTDAIRQVQLTVKEKLLAQMKNQSPAYGPEGGDIEGLVFKDLESDKLVKLVDREYFTALNKFMWFYRELLGRGVKVGDKWVPGIGQRLKNYISEEVIGSKVAKMSGLVNYLKRNYGTPKSHEEVDQVLAKYVTQEKLMKGDFLTRFGQVLEKTREEFEVVKNDWESRKDGKIEFQAKDGRTREMDPVIKQRTEHAFQDMEQTLDGLEKVEATVEAIPDEMTKKVAFLKIFMGEQGIEKLTGGSHGEKDVKEGKLNEDDSAKKRLNSAEATKMAEVVQANADKLARRGINISNAKPLGAGANGVAFDLGDHVLKITKDTKEANASQCIKGKTFSNIVKIFDVFKFPGDVKYFGIYQEKLQPIPPQDKNEFTEYITDIEVESGMFSKIWQLPSWAEVVDNAMEGAREDEEASQESIMRIRKELMVLQRKFQMDKMISQLQQAKIKFRDFHGGNIMLRGTEHVLIDLGYSQSPRKKIDVMEHILRLIEGPPPIPQKTARGQEPGVSPQAALKWVHSNYERLVRRGIKFPSNAQTVGRGTRGTAFDIGGGKILKITNDKTEAIASNKLKTLTLRHVVKIFDVFRFPEGDIYGILLEHLKPIPGTNPNDPNHVTGPAAELNDAIVTTNIRQELVKTGGDYARAATAALQYITHDKTQGLDAKAAIETVRKGKAALDTLKKFQIDRISNELRGSGIAFADFHAGNVMMRGSNYVVIDLGYSKVEDGKEPDVLEHIIKEIGVSYPVDFNPVDHTEDGEVEKYGKNTEAKINEKTRADTVGVTIGRYQPFHKGHAEIIRKLATRFTKVVVIVAGNKLDVKNPFSYELRREMMKDSLPDVEPKLEVYKAEVDGKASGYLPGILNRIIVDKSSAVEADTAVTILVGEDRFEDVKKMMQHSRDAKAKGQQSYFDPDMAVVEKLADVKNDDDTARVSGTRVREAIAKNDQKAVMTMMDPHLMSNPDEFNSLFKKMRDELGRFVKMNEDIGATAKGGGTLTSVGGRDGMKGIMMKNAELLKTKKNLNVQNAKELGAGQMGVAYDVGGGKVLKLTTDRYEAVTANYLKGKTEDHIARFFDVFQFKSEENETHVYGIVEELLTPLPENEQSEFNDFAEAYIRNNEIIQIVATKPFKDVWEAIRKMVIKDVLTDLGLPQDTNFDDPQQTQQKKVMRAKNIIENKLEQIKQVVQKYQLDQMVDELRKLNIQFADFHGGNLMKRGSDYVINDLGQSKSPGGEPPFLEGLVRSLADAISEAGGQGVGSSTDFGGTNARLRTGSSGWSSPSHNMTKKDVEDGDEDMQWQDMIPDPNLKMRP